MPKVTVRCPIEGCSYAWTIAASHSAKLVDITNSHIRSQHPEEWAADADEPSA